MKTALKIILPLLILAIALGLTVYQIKHKPIPEKKEKKKILPVVRVEAAEVGDFFFTAQGFGTVQASKTMSMVNDVAGRTVFVSPKLQAGATFRKGETIYEIEKTSYEASLASAVANLKSAQYTLSKTEQEADVSVKEWEIWNSAAEKSKAPSPLIKYEPQLQSARAAVDYAQKAVAKAESDLAKTVYKASFDCVISSETIELGMVIKSGESTGTLVGINEYEAVVPVASKDEAGMVLSEDMNRASTVEVLLTEGNVAWTWKGYASRVLPDADSKTGMAKVVVTIPHPNSKAEGRPSLTLGSNVECIIKGRKVSGLISLPKEGLRENGNVWVLESDTLKVKQVDVLGTYKGRVFVSGGINAGDKIIINRVQGAVDGMQVKLAGDSK